MKKLEDVITLSVVNFNAVWGKKEINISRILGYIKAAAKKGADMVVFPEMALTGYDDIKEISPEKKMQTLMAETIPGPATEQIELLSKKYGLYVIMGMPEKDEASGKIYNSLAVFSPSGLVGSYRKMHLPAPEPNWAERGENPFLLDTPWGPVGISICYDTYCFPEMTRYYAAKGARLCINSTALAKCHGEHLGTTTLEANVITNGIFVASANLCGLDVYNYFWGGSSIIGPSRATWAPYYFAGLPFTAENADEQEMYTATIDLSLSTRFLHKYNPDVGSPDFRPDKYIEMYSDLLKDENFGK